MVNYHTPRNEVRGGILDSPCLSVWPSVRLSVCLSVTHSCPPCSIYSSGWILSIFLVQMINSMRGCVACDDLWPWPISSRSFGLDLENRVRSVASTVLDAFFLPEASYGLRVLSLPASVCVCVCVCVYVCVCVRQSSVCPDDNLSPAQATITKFGPEVQNTLIKIPIVFGVHWPWPSRSNWT